MRNSWSFSPIIVPSSLLLFSPSSSDFLSAWGRTALHSFIPAFCTAFLNTLPKSASPSGLSLLLRRASCKAPATAGREPPRLNPLLPCPSPARGTYLDSTSWLTTWLRRKGIDEGVKKGVRGPEGLLRYLAGLYIPPVFCHRPTTFPSLSLK